MYYEIPSGEIVEEVKYLVTLGDVNGYVTYNGTDYYTGNFFTGVAGITTYTSVGSPAPIVVEASFFNALSFGYEVFYTGKFTDESYFKALATGGDIQYYFDDYTTEEIIQTDKYFTNTETLLYVQTRCDQITDIVGEELYNGVTYDRLVELAQIHPEITLIYTTNNNITEIQINGVRLFIDIFR